LCLGTILLAYSSNPLFFKIACYLIREGVKDVIKGVKACIDGEEINLKNYAIEKGISLVGFALELVVGTTPNIGSTFKDRFISAVKGQCINLVKSYGNRYIANKLVKIVRVETNPNYVGQGIATKLIQLAIKQFESYNFVLLCSPAKRTENTDTLKTVSDLQMFYSKFGFVKTTEFLPTMVKKAYD
jgi:GNAT superfamily N-acetyltransferase